MEKKMMELPSSPPYKKSINFLPSSPSPQPFTKLTQIFILTIKTIMSNLLAKESAFLPSQIQHNPSPSRRLFSSFPIYTVVAPPGHDHKKIRLKRPSSNAQKGPGKTPLSSNADNLPEAAPPPAQNKDMTLDAPMQLAQQEQPVAVTEGPMNVLLTDLAEIGISLDQIKEEVMPSIKRIQKFGRRKSSFFISHEFIEEMQDAKVQMNALRMFVVHNFNIDFKPRFHRCIQLEILRCAQLNPQFEVNSRMHRMFRFNWFLSAKSTGKGHLGLFLHAQPSDGFKGHWRIEADIRLCIWNIFAGKNLVKEDDSTIYEQDENGNHCQTAWGYRGMAKLTDLLNPANGFLHSNGSIKVDVNVELIKLCKEVKFTDIMAEQKNATATAVNDDGMEFGGMVDILMKDLAEMGESHSQITKELTRIQTHGTSDSVINDEFIVRMTQLKESMNVLKSMAADSINIKPIRKSIQLELKNCRELFAKKKFSVFSIKRKVLQFIWYLKARTEEKGFLCLILFAEPPDGFNGQYRMEIDDCCSVLTESTGKKLLDESFGNVFENNAEDPEHLYTGLGYDKLAKFEHLLDPTNGYLRADGSIMIEVDIVVKASTLNHLA